VDGNTICADAQRMIKDSDCWKVDLVSSIKFVMESGSNKGEKHERMVKITKQRHNQALPWPAPTWGPSLIYVQLLEVSLFPKLQPVEFSKDNDQGD